MRRAYSEGDYLVICDISGQKILRSDCVKMWNGWIVAKEYAESRHPLDLQKPPRIERAPTETRPPGTPVFLNPGDVTASDL